MTMHVNDVECRRDVPCCIHQESPVYCRKLLLAVRGAVKVVQGLVSNHLGHEKAAYRSITAKMQRCGWPRSNLFQGLIAPLHHTPELFLLCVGEGLVVNLGD